MSTRSGPGIINFDDELVQGWHQLLARLIRFPSVFEKEHAVVEMVAERISSLGIELHEVPISAPALKQLPDAQPPFSEVPNRKNLVARVPGSRHGRSLILNCHLDIVPAGNLEEWTRPAFGGQVDEARRIIYGRGAMDDKAGVAIGLAVLELAASKVIRPQGDLIVQFVLEANRPATVPCCAYRMDSLPTPP